MAIQLTEKQKQDGWQVVRFDEIAKNISERVEPGQTDLEIYVGLEHLDPQSLRITRMGQPSDVEGQKLRVRPGQIIFGKRRAYQKKVAVAHFDGICSAHAMVLEEIPGKIIPGLLPCFMQSDMFMDRAVAISEGSLSPTIKWKTLAMQEFPLPPVERQKRILEVLEKIEECSQLVDESLGSLILGKKKLLDKLLLKNKEYMQIFANVVIDSAFGPRYPSDKYSINGNIGTIRTTDFSEDSRINYKSIPFANLDEEKFANHILKTGDIIITRSGTIGQVDVFYEQPLPIIAGAFQIRFSLSNKVLPEYVREALLLPFVQEQIKKMSNGGVQKNITSTSLLKVLLPIPQKQVQQSILSLLGSLNAEISILQKKKSAFSIIQKNLICFEKMEAN